MWMVRGRVARHSVMAERLPITPSIRVRTDIFFLNGAEIGDWSISSRTETIICGWFPRPDAPQHRTL